MVTVVLTLTLGATILKALRRATRRAAFDVPVSFARHPASGTHAAPEAPAASRDGRRPSDGGAASPPGGS